MVVQLYVMGMYQGEREIGDDSICGRLLSDDYQGAMSGIEQMNVEIKSARAPTITSTVAIYGSAKTATNGYARMKEQTTILNCAIRVGLKSSIA